MKCTVAICTWNRQELLGRTLESLTRMSIPDELDWEVLVVDNNSTDGTRDVARSFEARLPLRILYEGTPGKTHALNRAVDAASGDWIVWTDDDVRVAEDWLGAFARAFRTHPDVGFFGGAVVPEFEGEGPPAWLERSLSEIAGVYAITRVSEGEVRMDDPHLPYGANLALRMDVQRRYSYDTGLGRRAGNLIGGSETDVLRRALADGVRGLWWPSALVHHYIPVERQRIEYVRRFFHDHAASPSHRESGGKGPRSFLGRPLWAWKDALLYELRYRFHRLTSDPEVWIEDLKYASSAQGRLTGRPRKR